MTSIVLKIFAVLGMVLGLLKAPGSTEITGGFQPSVLIDGLAARPM